MSVAARRSLVVLEYRSEFPTLFQAILLSVEPEKFRGSSHFSDLTFRPHPQLGHRHPSNPLSSELHFDPCCPPPGGQRVAAHLAERRNCVS